MKSLQTLTEGLSRAIVKQQQLSTRPNSNPPPPTKKKPPTPPNPSILQKECKCPFLQYMAH